MESEKANIFRSILFLPATRSDRYEKALGSGADVACVDLEDSVAPDQKDVAREIVTDFFKMPVTTPLQRALRINQLACKQGLEDMLLVLALEQLPDIVLIPKVESPEEIAWFNEVTASIDRPVSLIPLIETAKGLQNAIDIARAPNVRAIGFGTADYAADVGADMSWESLIYARGRILQAAGYADIAAVDGPWLQLDDDKGLLKDTRRAAAMGFSGKIALHPRQLKWIHKGFVPSEEALNRARRIVDAYRANKDGVLVVDGRMVDMPVVERAQRLIELAGRR
ncbi:CoA ester lyase [Microbulbifer sp. GL-2]|uniref:HpcH/HpaI aldolase/citrate lyase family protein n=1 Tax=Microbulbifer sp. GL-2 TaxID=2591606 RepID=UPI001162A988|nr:CoA ester lyase [Microbulbifer sp. GL-2]BBM02795.1 citrate lyase subunit beta [Microbulbifer sp. GL-2]